MMTNSNNKIHFYILVPFYNAEKWIVDCLDSIANQKVDENKYDYTCLVIDDASTDNSNVQYTNWKNNNKNPRFEFRKRTENKKALYNIVKGFLELDTHDYPESVLMIIDGDDKLATPNVLETIYKTYRDNPDLLLTYGNHKHSVGTAASNCTYFPKEILDNDDYRKYKFITSHLRTFKSKLWNEVRDKDMIDPNTGNYFSSAWDVSFMIPMLEMAGKDRFKFIEDILYIYNMENPISDHVVRGNEQGSIDAYIRTLPRYKKI